MKFEIEEIRPSGWVFSLVDRTNFNLHYKHRKSIFVQLKHVKCKSAISALLDSTQTFLNQLFRLLTYSVLLTYSEICRVETVQDFLIKLGIKPRMHILEISIFSLNHVIVRPTKIINNLLKDCKILTFKVIFQRLKSTESS